MNTLDYRRSDEALGVGTPGIAITFVVFGWLFLGIGCLAAIIAASNDATDAVAIGASLMLFSFFPFGFAALISRVHKIEHHLRPRETPSDSSPTEHPSTGSIEKVLKPGSFGT